MIILGIETSCDETSAAVLHNDTVISNVTVVQYFHSRYGGVVPELASRAHQRLIVPIVDEAINKASVSKKDISAIAAVKGPGLIGSLVVGLSFAKAMSVGLSIPFVGVNHLEAHLLSPFLESTKPEFPFVSLTVSGGHTQLVYVKNFFEYEVLGTTLDDAAGEAFDKVAKMLGIGYPGGPLIDKLAREGNAEAVKFPRPWLNDDSFSFSFSGLKTSVLYYLKKYNFKPTEAPTQFVKDVCAGFQASVVEVLVGKLIRAAKKKAVKTVAVAGGVAANTALRKYLEAEAQKYGLTVCIPRLEYCTDNAAMVAFVGYKYLCHKKESPLTIAVEPNLQLVSQGDISEQRNARDCTLA